MPIWLIILLSISVVFNIIFITRHYLRRNEMDYWIHQLKKVIDGESQSIVKGDLSNERTVQLLDEINRLISKINEINIRYEKASLQNKQLISSISHDFRTPLTSMLGYVQMLKSDQLTKQQEKFVSIIEERAQVLHSLIEEFYTLSIIDSNEHEQTTELFNPILAIQEQLALYYEDLNQTFDTVQINLEEKFMSIHSSKSNFNRIVSNLLKNAFTHGINQFSLNYEENEKGVKFLFSNEVPEAESINTNQIFDRMYQVDPSRNTQSTGLGLAIAKELSEQSGYQLEASLENNVIIFKLFIPVNTMA